jgi:lipopolysaccharide/colanic/teichoic acid biosynthesis glycosyltransferase
MYTAAIPSRSPSKPQRKRREPLRLLIISEQLFNGVLIKERKRADRLNQPLVLLIVALKDRIGTPSPWIWAPVIEALATVTRETDVVGWFESQTAIGVILPEVHAMDALRVRELEDRFSRELIKRSDADALRRLSIRLHVQSDLKHMSAASHSRIGSDDFPASHARKEPATIYDGIKRGLDVIGSTALLILLAPLLLVIAAAVKLKSSGPVFFEQERVGQQMKPFKMLKFRTMYANVDQKLHHEYVTRFICSSGGGKPCDTPGVFKLTNDPRVTPIGRFLRKTSLDELPQLLNVLRGNMSLVGPRPPLPYEVEQYKSWHCRRVLDAKPGITGLWQVTGRSRTTFDEMVRLDLRYARTCSIWNDIKILLATPGAVFSGKGAC